MSGLVPIKIITSRLVPPPAGFRFRRGMRLKLGARNGPDHGHDFRQRCRRLGLVLGTGFSLASAAVDARSSSN